MICVLRRDHEGPCCAWADQPEGRIVRAHGIDPECSPTPATCRSRHTREECAGSLNARSFAANWGCLREDQA